MKITRVETLVLNLPMIIDGATPMLGGRARTSIDMLLVRIDTDGGITGWGEAFGHRIFHATRAAIDTLLGPMCVGRDPGQIAALNDELQRALHGVGRNGPVIYALSGIDIALWDIAGKVAGLPLYRLLGGSARADLPAYASLLRYGPLTRSLSTPGRRWRAATDTSSSTRSRCPRSRPPGRLPAPVSRSWSIRTARGR
jgi:D-galactarolactone cycloisomerase